LSAADDLIEALQTKLAFQEDAVQQLSDALVAQQARIDRLESRLGQLVEELRAKADAGDDVPEPPPPHY
jgi:SlyX protein